MDSVAESTAQARKTRAGYSISEKQAVLAWHAEHGRVLNATARQFGVERSSLRLWLRQAELIAAKSADPATRHHTRVRPSHINWKYEALNEAVKQWVDTQHAAYGDRPIAHKDIRACAMRRNREMGGDPGFTASHGWVESFMRRWGKCSWPQHSDTISDARTAVR